MYRSTMWNATNGTWLNHAVVRGVTGTFSTAVREVTGTRCTGPLDGRLVGGLVSPR